MNKNIRRASSKFNGCSLLQRSCNLMGNCNAVGYYFNTKR